MKKLKFGLIGAGRFGKHYMRLLQKNKNAQLACVCVRTQKALNEIFCSIPNGTNTTADAKELLEDQNIDGVIIATPFFTHYGLALKALKEEKHVLLEKPMVQTLSQAKKLSKAVNTSGKTFMVGHQYVYNDHINYIKAQNEKNFFGKMRFATAVHLYNFPRKDIGCFWDAGTHQLAVIEHLFSPGNITSIYGNAVKTPGNFFDDNVNVSLEFENKLQVTILISSVSILRSRKFIFDGEKKTAMFDDSANAPLLEILSGNGMPKVQKISAREPLKNELDHFIRCIKTKEAPKTGIAHSVTVTKMLCKISEKLKIPTSAKLTT